MQKISLFALIFVLIACSAPAQVIPTTPVRITVPPTSIPTSIPTLTETATPVPTETAMDGKLVKEGLVPIEVADMASLDINKIFEKGTVFKVQNVFQEGTGNFEVLDVKLPMEGEIFEYPTFRSLTGPTLKGIGFTVNTASFDEFLILRMALLRGDLLDNSKTADGELTALELATTINGQKAKFVILLTGNIFENKATDLIFKNFQPGQVLQDLAITYIPEDGVTIDIMEDTVLQNSNNLTPEKLAKWRFNVMRNGGEGMTLKKLKELMLSGRVITTNEIVVNGIE